MTILITQLTNQSKHRKKTRSLNGLTNVHEQLQEFLHSSQLDVVLPFSWIWFVLFSFRITTADRISIVSVQ